MYCQSKTKNNNNNNVNLTTTTIPRPPRSVGGGQEMQEVLRWSGGVNQRPANQKPANQRWWVRLWLARASVVGKLHKKG